MNDIDNDIEFEGQDELELTSPPHQMGTDTQVRIAKEQSSIFEILRREARGDLVLAPDFQRQNVWDKKHKSELIESILMGIPIPLIYLFEDEEGVRQIIDGKQRITALKEFINNEFNLSYLSMLPQLKGYKFNEISPLLQAKIEDYQLHSYIIQPPTPESVKFNIFERVNRGGINLNKQEMRHALYLGKSTDLIHELAESQEFKLSTGNGVKPNRMRDRYLILRFVAFYLLTTDQLPKIQYRSDVDSFLASVMKFLNTQAKDSLIKHVKWVCLFGMKNVYQVLGHDAFRFSAKNGGNRRPVNMGLFEMIVFSFSYIDPSKISSDKAKAIVEDYKIKVDEQELFSGSIDTSEYVRIRFDTAQQITERVNNA
ncbi:MAG: hypothetical protein ACJA1Z_002945 [Patiriisocius sp.]|jgi:hypothetical protein